MVELQWVPQAVLLDLDGTLADSEGAWQVAVRELAAQFDVDWSQSDEQRIVGLAIPDVAALLRDGGVLWPSAQIEHWLHERVLALQDGQIPWREGARELLTALVQAQVPTALVTMSYRRIALQVAQAAPAGSLSVVVAGDDVVCGKPDPEAYLTAAKLLGVEIDRCVAVEDSATGAAAALRSGALTFVVQPATELGQWATHKHLRRVETLNQLQQALTRYECGVWHAIGV